MGVVLGTVLGTEERWQAIDRERAGLTDLLESLSPDEWELPTQCGGWRVRDVAAHLTLAPRISYGTAVREFVRARGNADRMIHDTAVRAADRPPRTSWPTSARPSAPAASPPAPPAANHSSTSSSTARTSPSP